MKFRKLKIDDTKSFTNLILDMYKTIDSIEWFTPMPFTELDVAELITNPRLYILGAFNDDELCAVASLDYKCGKLIGKVDFPKYCDTDKLIESGFVMVHSKFRGKGIMKELIVRLCHIAKEQGYHWIFSKVHKDNLASSNSYIRKGFTKFCDYNKPVKINHLELLIAGHVLSERVEENIKNRLKNNNDPEFLYVNYEMFIKELL